MSNFDMVRFRSADELAQAVAQQFLSCASKSAQGFSVALSGGRIAGRLYSALAALGPAARDCLQTAQLFWGDERCVPPDDPESNYGLAHEVLLGPLGIPQSQIHRIRGEAAPDEAARQAEAELRKLVSAEKGQPALNLVFLGMGEDGHVASLFPGEPDSIIQSAAVFRAVNAPKPPPLRITIGYPALVAARAVWVLASGAGKRQALEHSLASTGNTPLAKVLRYRSSTTIFTDLLEAP